jgi:hypothetical protein
MVARLSVAFSDLNIASKPITGIYIHRAMVHHTTSHPQVLLSPSLLLRVSIIDPTQQAIRQFTSAKS